MLFLQGNPVYTDTDGISQGVRSHSSLRLNESVCNVVHVPLETVSTKISLRSIFTLGSRRKLALYALTLRRTTGCGGGGGGGCHSPKVFLSFFS